MKKIILLICSLISMQTFGQTSPKFDLVSSTCSLVSPPPADTLTYNFQGDTLTIKIIKYGHCCAKPNTTILLIADTIKFTIQDTASTICTCDCPFEYSYRLYGFTGNLYVTEAFNKTYIIKRIINSIQTYPSFKPGFERTGRILKVLHLNYDFRINVYDLKGSLKYSLFHDTIDLNTLNLKSGIYLFQLNIKGEQLTEKVYIE
jgi:hypothetical protein